MIRTHSRFVRAPRNRALVALITAGLSCAAVAGCGGSGDDDASTSAPDAGAPAVDAAPVVPDATAASHLRVGVPADFTGTPRQLVVVVHTTPSLQGIPDGILYQADGPAVSAGVPIDLALDTSLTTGTYYVTTIVYVVGGGQFVPMSGVDYVATSPAAFTFDGTVVDLGELDLALAP